MTEVIERVQLPAGTASSGKVAYEEVLAERLGANHYRLLKSPGLVLGLAAGDEFRIAEDGSFEVTQRAGNVCIQWFRRSGVDECIGYLATLIEGVGGWVDGRTEKEAVLTLPVAAGFPAIERLLHKAGERFPDSEWYYGNVYDPSDGVTPLNWW